MSHDFPDGPDFDPEPRDDDPWDAPEAHPDPPEIWVWDKETGWTELKAPSEATDGPESDDKP